MLFRNYCDLASGSVAPECENLFEFCIRANHTQFFHLVGLHDLREAPKAQGCVCDRCCVEGVLPRNRHPPIAKPRTNEEGLNDCRAPARTVPDSFEPRQVSGLPVTCILVDHLGKRDIPGLALSLRDVLGPIDSEVSGGWCVLGGTPQQYFFHRV